MERPSFATIADLLCSISSAVTALVRARSLEVNGQDTGVVRQRLLGRLLNNVGRLAHLTGPQVGDDSVSFPLSSVGLSCAWMAFELWLQERD